MTRVTATLSALLLAVILFSVAPGAQAPTAGPGQVQSAALSANGDTGQFSLYQATGGAIQFSGTFVGTLQFEATINGTTWNALSVTPTAGGSSVTSATATGSWTFSNPGYTNVRVRASAWTSGAVLAQVTTVGPGVAQTSGYFADGSAASPGMSFTSAPTTGMYRTSADSLVMSTGGTARFRFSATGSLIMTGSLFMAATGADLVNSVLVISSTSPTISSGFGTSPSIVSNNGTATVRINVGTGGVATSGVVGMPAATAGWNCQVQDMTNNTVTRQTASTTTSVTFTAAAAWAASDVLIANCIAY